MLQETSTSALPFTKFSKELSSGSSGKLLPFGSRGKEQKLSIAEPKSNIHPVRSSSLTHGRSATDGPTTGGQVIFENGQYQDRPAPNQESAANSAKNGMPDLAGNRAQLLVVQRRLFEQIGTTLGWKIGWVAIIPTLNQKEEMTDINLDEEDEESAPEKDISDVKQGVDQTTPILGLSAGVLLNAVSSVEKFRQYYEVDMGYFVYEVLLILVRP